MVHRLLFLIIGLVFCVSTAIANVVDYTRLEKAKYVRIGVGDTVEIRKKDDTLQLSVRHIGKVIGEIAVEFAEYDYVLREKQKTRDGSSSLIAVYDIERIDHAPANLALGRLRAGSQLVKHGKFRFEWSYRSEREISLSLAKGMEYRIYKKKL